MPAAASTLRRSIGRGGNVSRRRSAPPARLPNASDLPLTAENSKHRNSRYHSATISPTLCTLSVRTHALRQSMPRGSKTRGHARVAEPSTLGRLRCVWLAGPSKVLQRSRSPRLDSEWLLTTRVWATFGRLFVHPGAGPFEEPRERSQKSRKNAGTWRPIFCPASGRRRKRGVPCTPNTFSLPPSPSSVPPSRLSQWVAGTPRPFLLVNQQPYTCLNRRRPQGSRW